MSISKKKKELIYKYLRDFDKLRALMSSMYLSKSKSRKEMADNKLAGSNTSTRNMIDRINLFMNLFLDTHKAPNRKRNRKIYRLDNNIFSDSYNFLACAYQYCLFDIKDLMSYYYILNELNMLNNKAYDCRKINTKDGFARELLINIELDFFDDIDDFEDKYKGILSKDIIKIRLDEICDLGIIKYNNPSSPDFDENKSLYYIADNIFRYKTDDKIVDMSFEDIEKINEMVHFFYNMETITVPGYFLSISLDQYMRTFPCYKYDEDNPYLSRQESSIFMYNHNGIETCLDDNISYKLLEAVHKKIPVIYTYNMPGNKIHVKVYPIKFVQDIDYNRQYIFIYDISDGTYRMDRISYINNVSLLKNHKKHKIENEDYNALYNHYTKNVWNVSLGEFKLNPNKLIPSSKVKITFDFSDCKDLFYRKRLLNKLKYTKHSGTIKDIGDRFIFECTSKDPNELVPWIRSFGKYAIVDKDTNPDIREKLLSNAKEALANYGIVQ